MTKTEKKIQIGLLVMIPLVLSMLFIGLNNYTSATTDGGPELNQSEAGVYGWANINLILEIDGSSIEGESIVTSLDRENSIEIMSFRYELTTPREDASGALTGRRQHSPIVITKMVTKTSPLLFKALVNNEPVTSAEFRFFRPTPGGEGGEEWYYTVKIENGYVASVRQFTFVDYRGGTVYTLEEVSFIFQDITWTYEVGGATHQDSWRGEA